MFEEILAGFIVAAIAAFMVINYMIKLGGG
jgi:hypothetical protein